MRCEVIENPPVRGLSIQRAVLCCNVGMRCFVMTNERYLMNKVIDDRSMSGVIEAIE